MTSVLKASYLAKYLWVAYTIFGKVSGWATPGIMIKRPV
jgi:hypothetical protein